MSSFICSSKHFNSIEYALKTLAENTNFYFPYSLTSKIPALADRAKSVKFISKVVDELRKINALSVSLQYKDHYKGTLDNEIKTQTEILLKEKRSKKAISIISLYKALNCLSYQIEENHIEELRELSEDEKTALIFLAEIQNAIACHIVDSMPEYDKGEWEIN